MDKWQYKVLDWPTSGEKRTLEEVLNSLGKQGWETMGVGGWGWGNSEGYKEHSVGFKIILKKKLA